MKLQHFTFFAIVAVIISCIAVPSNARFISHASHLDMLHSSSLGIGSSFEPNGRNYIQQNQYQYGGASGFVRHY